MPPLRPLDPLLRRDGFDAPGSRPPRPLPTPDPAGPGPSLMRLGMWLFIASLAMLFGASLVGYLVTRLMSPAAPPPGYFTVPAGFYASTVALLGAGLAVELAARSGSTIGRRNALVATAVLSAAFVALQAGPLVELFAQHARASAEFAVGLYGLIFTLIVVHAAHVIGGLVPLAVVVFNQLAPDRPRPTAATVRALALYWHFLDAVWLTMLGVFVFTR